MFWIQILSYLSVSSVPNTFLELTPAAKLTLTFFVVVRKSHPLLHVILLQLLPLGLERFLPRVELSAHFLRRPWFLQFVLELLLRLELHVIQVLVIGFAIVEYLRELVQDGLLERRWRFCTIKFRVAALNTSIYTYPCSRMRPWLDYPPRISGCTATTRLVG